MKIKVSQATPLQLDWMVATIEGFKPEALFQFDEFDNPYYDGPEYATDPAQAYPIIERGDINVTRYTHSEVTESGKEIYRMDGWTAFTTIPVFWATPIRQYGPTPLIAAMRCYVVSKLGDEVEVPDALAN